MVLIVLIVVFCVLGIAITLFIIHRRRKQHEDQNLDQTTSSARPGSILLLDEGEQSQFISENSTHRVRHSVHQNYLDTPISEPNDSYQVDNNFDTIASIN